jgi:hypothetical protein
MSKVGKMIFAGIGAGFHGEPKPMSQREIAASWDKVFQEVRAQQSGKQNSRGTPRVSPQVTGEEILYGNGSTV